MVCRHAEGDPNCSSYPGWLKRKQEEEAHQEAFSQGQEARKTLEDLLARTPNPDHYDVMDVEQVGRHLVMKVRYSSCEKCSFDSQKVMVFENMSMKQALMWKRIDPHFSNTVRIPTEAPAPRARFPADPRGWGDALQYAANLGSGRKT